MTTQQSLRGAQFRLANHYVTKLQQANTATRHGHESRTHWFKQIDRDWSQIKHWQNWTTIWTETDVEKAHFCIAFATAGIDVLVVRQTPAERIAWLKPALQAARELKDDAAERHILAHLGLAYVLTDNDLEANHHLQCLLQMSIEAKDDLNIGRTYRAMGILARRRGEYDTSESYLQQSLDIFDRQGETALFGRVLQGIAQVARLKGEYQRAYDHYIQYLSIVQRSGREGELAVALQSVGNCLQSMRDFRAAEPYLQRVVNICRQIQYTRVLPQALSNLGCCEFELGKLESCYAHFEEAVQLARSTNDPASLLNGLANLGYILARRGDYAQAIDHLKEALDLAYEARRPVFICNVQHDLAHTYATLGDREAARVALREALEAAVSLGTELHKSKTLVTAVLLWQRNGDALQGAIWAGLLVKYTQHLDLHLFEPICRQLEIELGTRQYHDALEQGNALTLDGVIEEVLCLL